MEPAHLDFTSARWTPWAPCLLSYQDGMVSSNQSYALQQVGLHLSRKFPVRLPIPIPTCRQSCIVNSHRKSQVLFLISLFIFSFSLTTSKVNILPKPKFLSQSSLVSTSRLVFILIYCIKFSCQVLRVMGSQNTTWDMYLLTCYVHKQDRDPMPHHRNSYLGFLYLPRIRPVSELLCNKKGKHPNKQTLQLSGGFWKVFLSAIVIQV